VVCGGVGAPADGAAGGREVLSATHLHLGPFGSAAAEDDGAPLYRAQLTDSDSMKGEQERGRLDDYHHNECAQDD
jgi:hypothetical protein